MRALAERILGLLPSSVEYGDVRVVRRRHQGVHIENDRVAQLVLEETEGIGLRVLVGGQWGFAASTRTDVDGLAELVRIAVGQAGAASGPRSRLAPAPVVEGTWSSPCIQDPFEVPLDERIELLLESARIMRAAGPAVVSAQASADAYRDEKLFASTEGSRIEQVITETGAGLLATARNETDVQRRSYPQSVPRAIIGERGDFANAGWEHVRSLRLVEAAARVGEEAAALLSADRCPPATTTLIVGASQMAQLVHETAGHPSELDRTLGAEDSTAGGTYMLPAERGRQRFGTEPGHDRRRRDPPGCARLLCLGRRGCRRNPDHDHRGRHGGRVPVLAGVGRVARRSPRPGAARADGWRRIPLVRMTNVSIEPGDTPLDEMIGTTRDGILIDMNRSLSIDDRRRSFRFGAEIAWEIRDGRLGRMLRDPTYEGDTLEFWAGCDAVGDRASFRQWGLPSCNKGEPLQVAHIGHGAVPARFRNARVGV